MKAMGLASVAAVAKQTGLSLSASSILLDAAMGDVQVAISLYMEEGLTNSSTGVSTPQEEPAAFLLCESDATTLEGVWSRDFQMPLSHHRPVYRKDHLYLYFAIDHNSDTNAWVIGSVPGHVESTEAILVHAMASRPYLIANNARWLLKPISTQKKGSLWREISCKFSACPPPAAECVCCLDAEVSALLWPCGHPCLCESCAASLQKSARSSLRCPLCRDAVKRVHYVA